VFQMAMCPSVECGSPYEVHTTKVARRGVARQRKEPSAEAKGSK